MLRKRRSFAKIARRSIEFIVHLAAEAGVQHSPVDPYAYVQSNVIDHLTNLEGARLAPRVCMLNIGNHRSELVSTRV
jgi:dTDP-D-glucose 4,6-dehydratase